MKIILILLTLFLTSLAIFSFGQSYQSTDTLLVASDSSQLYFPLSSDNVSIDDAFDSSENTWYSQHLFSLKEPIIFNATSRNEIYRFTWLRSFDNAVAIRIERHGDNYYLFWKVSDGKGGYAPGKLIINKQISIDKATWQKFKKCLRQCDFWNLKTNVLVLNDDGAQWILEGKENKNYHVVVRWSPTKEASFYKCCNMLIELTDLNIKSEEKY